MSARRPGAIAAAALLALAVSCGGGRAPGRDAAVNRGAPPESAVADSARRAALDTLPPAAPPRVFSRVGIRGAATIAALRDTLGPAGWHELLKLNRVDSVYVRQGDSVVVAEPFGDSLALSPFPLVLPAARDSAKLLLVSLRVQAFAAYDSGRLARWGPVSSGRRAMPTPVGLYHTNWKDQVRVSTFDEEWLLRWYINLHNFQGVSLHQYELPGRPASHSCLRLLEVDARWLYAWCDQWQLAPDRRTIRRHGTPVVVFGEWRWGRRAPWKRLPEHPDACTLAPEEIADALRVMTDGVVPEFIAAPADSLNTRHAAPADSSRAPADSAGTAGREARGR